MRELRPPGGGRRAGRPGRARGRASWDRGALRRLSQASTHRFAYRRAPDQSRSPLLHRGELRRLQHHQHPPGVVELRLPPLPAAGAAKARGRTLRTRPGPPVGFAVRAPCHLIRVSRFRMHSLADAFPAFGLSPPLPYPAAGAVGPRGKRVAFSKGLWEAVLGPLSKPAVGAAPRLPRKAPGPAGSTALESPGPLPRLSMATGSRGSRLWGWLCSRADDLCLRIFVGELQPLLEALFLLAGHTLLFSTKKESSLAKGASRSRRCDTPWRSPFLGEGHGGPQPGRGGANLWKLRGRGPRRGRAHPTSDPVEPQCDE